MGHPSFGGNLDSPLMSMTFSPDNIRLGSDCALGTSRKAGSVNALPSKEPTDGHYSFYVCRYGKCGRDRLMVNGIRIKR